jgi:hypothetical protein
MQHIRCRGTIHRALLAQAYWIKAFSLPSHSNHELSKKYLLYQIEIFLALIPVPIAKIPCTYSPEPIP